MNNITEHIKPIPAGVLGMVASAANAAVWIDLIKGWAGAVTMLIGVPTALLMLTYWALKVRTQWKNAKELD